jgi:hypothetical protein
MLKCLAQSIVVGTSTSSITFGSIPQNYKSLMIYFSGGANVSGIWTSFLSMNYNGTAGQNRATYCYVDDGSETATHGSGFYSPTQTLAGNSASNLQPGVGWIFIADYSGTTFPKKGFNYGGLAGNTGNKGSAGMTAFFATPTNAVTSITFSSNSGGNFNNGSSIYLYGIS